MKNIKFLQWSINIILEIKKKKNQHSNVSVTIQELHMHGLDKVQDESEQFGKLYACPLVATMQHCSEGFDYS